MTAMGGVTASGGADFAGDLSHLTVWRSRQGGTRKKIEVDVDDVENGQARDVTLRAGDVVEVPASPIRIGSVLAYWALTRMVAVGTYFPLF